MALLPTSGIPLFRLFGIQVSLHWSWFIIVYLAVQQRMGTYVSPIWNVVEVLSLFGIVLMHEFGHALACRSVGGRAERIMLWPLGGVAFVDPPQRPGAVLWSIVAGPLVNAILLPITSAALLFVPAGTDLRTYVEMLWTINLSLLFNMLPIYPLDGGQILRALLWFVIGPGKSLMAASVIGLIGAGAGMLLALLLKDTWLVIIALFAASQSWVGFQHSKRLCAVAEVPRRSDVHCPACGVPPMREVQLMCTCGRPYDVFLTGGRCPHCGTVASAIQCPDCGYVSHPATWRMVSPVYVAPGQQPA